MEPDLRYVVTGYIDYVASGYTWREYRLEAGDEIRWLEVGEDDGVLEITWWREIDLELPIPGQPPHALDYGPRHFTLKENDTAQAVIVGETGRRSAGTCRYWEYTSEGSRQRLAIEQWGGETEVCVGERLDREQLEIFRAAAQPTV